MMAVYGRALVETIAGVMMTVQLPVVGEIPAIESRLVVRAEFPTFTPGAFFDHWTEPDLLQRWWPQEATIDLRPGGDYHLAWPRMDWHLRGHYTAVERGQRLAFTWRWDHEPDDAKEVLVTFAPREDGGTVVLIAHGPYTDSAHDREMRAGHLEGWNYFLARLRALRPNR